MIPYSRASGFSRSGRCHGEKGFLDQVGLETVLERLRLAGAFAGVARDVFDEALMRLRTLRSWTCHHVQSSRADSYQTGFTGRSARAPSRPVLQAVDRRQQPAGAGRAPEQVGGLPQRLVISQRHDQRRRMSRRCCTGHRRSNSVGSPVSSARRCLIKVT